MATKTKTKTLLKKRGDCSTYFLIRRAFPTKTRGAQVSLLYYLICAEEALKVTPVGHWFPCPTKQLEVDLDLTQPQQSHLLKELRASGWIETMVQGFPPSRLVRLNHGKLGEVIANMDKYEPTHWLCRRKPSKKGR